MKPGLLMVISLIRSLEILILSIIIFAISIGFLSRSFASIKGKLDDRSPYSGLLDEETLISF